MRIHFYADSFKTATTRALLFNCIDAFFVNEIDNNQLHLLVNTFEP